MRRAVFCMIIGMAGCSSSTNSGPSCTDKFSACGRDLTGTWKSIAVCGRPNQVIHDAYGCTGYTLTHAYRDEITTTYGADQKYTAALSEVESFTHEIPASCHVLDGGPGVF